MEISEKAKAEVLPILRGLEVNGTAEFPAERYNYVRSACSSFGTQWDRSFETRMDKEARTVTVTRTR